MPARRTTRLTPIRRDPWLEPLETRALLSTQLVGDFNADPGSSEPSAWVYHQGWTYFTADNGMPGRGLWRTDGTPEGTMFVNKGSPTFLGAAGRWLYFSTGISLWRTDGTPQNTSVFTGYYGPPTGNAAAANGELYFVTGLRKLYVTQADAVSPVTPRLVKDLGPGASSAREMVSTGTKVYLTTADNKLWVSDGTSDGTLVLNPPDDSLTTIWDVVAVGDTVYFSIRVGVTNDFQLWKRGHPPRP